MEGREIDVVINLRLKLHLDVLSDAEEEPEELAPVTMLQPLETMGNGRAYTCEVCGKDFDNIYARNSHMQAHKRKKASAVCEVCDKPYNSPGALGMHRRLAHGIPSPRAAQNREAWEKKKARLNGAR